MDLLSRLLAATPVTGRVEVRCHLGSPWRLEQARADPREIPFHVVLGGTAVVEGGEQAARPLQAGDIVLFPGGAPHALHDGSGRRPRPIREHASATLMVAQNTGRGERADVLCGRFVLPEASERLVVALLPGRLIVSSADEQATDTKLARLVGLMREESLEEGAGSQVMVGHLCAALFALTLRFASAAENAPQGMLALARNRKLQPAVLAMFDKPHKPWTLPDLAALCSMSRATLARQFEAAIGASPNDLLTQIRMMQAARKLLQSSESVAAIGESVGYFSESAFQRAFSRHMGASPARWRANAGEASLSQSSM
jgi:AraC family transcriptional activator of mtrCDE